MLFRLILLFTLVPFVELTLLLWLSDVTSFQFTVLLVLVTGVVGAWLARLQGFHTWRKIHEQMARGEAPAGSLVDALLIFVAGALLLTPGILTDGIGFCLLIPPIRAVIKSWAAKRFRSNMVMQQHGQTTFWSSGFQQSSSPHSPNGQDERIIEVEATHRSERPDT